jgi:DNA processing protein
MVPIKNIKNTTMLNEEHIYLHALNIYPGFGPVKLLLLLNVFGSAKDAFFASESQLIKSGISGEDAKNFSALKTKINIEEEIQKLSKNQIDLLIYTDKNYPKLLLEISKFPPILYVKGKIINPDELCVSIVGTRKISNYGRTVIGNLISPLVSAGVTIVSGMAFGIDASAHQLALDQKRRTIAVLGGGLDDASIYPKHHQLLAQNILDNGGALISEYPIGTPSLKHHFISRNRIISGLSVATGVIECDLQSGSLITAKYALEQNRNVYAVPGPIYQEGSKGPNNLIKMGAKPFTCAEDILEDLNLKTYPAQQKVQSLFGDNAEESTILKILSLEPIGINDLIKLSGLEAGKTTSALTFLEMKGKVKNLGGQQYILSR